MRKLLALLFVAQLEVLFPSSAVSAEVSSASWISERCAVYGRGYCRIPFQVVVASARELGDSGVKIQLRGYLVKEQEGYAIYSDIQAARRGWRTDAILIRDTSDDALRKSLIHWNQSLVEVRGRVALVASDHDEYWIQMNVEQPVSVTGIRGEKLRD